jgi:hypothetical protein
MRLQISKVTATASAGKSFNLSMTKRSYLVTHLQRKLPCLAESKAEDCHPRAEKGPRRLRFARQPS